jgi:hypothetical protein
MGNGNGYPTFAYFDITQNANTMNKNLSSSLSSSQNLQTIPFLVHAVTNLLWSRGRRGLHEGE